MHIVVLPTIRAADHQLVCVVVVSVVCPQHLSVRPPEIRKQLGLRRALEVVASGMVHLVVERDMVPPLVVVRWQLRRASGPSRRWERGYQLVVIGRL